MIQMIRPTIEEIRSGCTFGMAWDPVFSANRQPEDLIAASKMYPAIAVPFEYLEIQKENDKLEKLKRTFSILHTGSFLDDAVAKNLPYASESIHAEFRSYSGQILTAARQAGLETLTFDPNLNQILDEEMAKNALIRLLKDIAPILLNLNITLLFPFSFPPKSTDSIKNLSAFLRNVMIPQVKLRLDVYPHLLKPTDHPVLQAKHLFTEVRAVFFRYNADSGNVLVPEHLEPWITEFAKKGFYGPYFAAPQTNRPELMEHESAAFLRVLEQIPKKTQKTAEDNLRSMNS